MTSIPGSWDIANRTLILLDGVEQHEVTAYDCDAGTVEVLMRGDDGQFLIDAVEGTIRKQTLTGNVTVRWRDADDR